MAGSHDLTIAPADEAISRWPRAIKLLGAGSLDLKSCQIKP